MNKLKYIMTLVASLSALVFISSCDQEDPLTPETSKYIIFNREGSVIPTRIQFSKDIKYFFRLSFDSNYLQEDSISVLAYFTSGTDTVNIDLYDDGVIDDSLRNDLAASNNVWSGGINAQSYPAEGDWRLNIESVKRENTIKVYEPVEGIRVRSNTAPDIVSVTGLTENDTLNSGFTTRNIVVKVDDPDNDASGYNDNQTLRLEIRNRDNIPKDYEFTRQNPLSDIVFQLDSTLAASLKTNNRYNMTFIATDLYGEKDSLALDYIRIENTAPEIKNLLFSDTVIVPADTSLFVFYKVTINVNDPQGHLENQDIKEVLLTTNSSNSMRDDGDQDSGEYSSGDLAKDDGIYTVTFKVKGAYFFPNPVAVLPFNIKAYDKAENESNLIEDVFVFVKDSKSRIKRDKNEQEFNYINPFSTY